MKREPEIGAKVAFGRNECEIEVAALPSVQPLAAVYGIYAFVDQYGERHVCEAYEEDDAVSYEIVTPGQLDAYGASHAEVDALKSLAFA